MVIETVIRLWFSLAVFSILFSCQVKKRVGVGIMTYNIRYEHPDPNGWDGRKELLIAQLNQYHPDILGLQEANIHQLEDIMEGIEAPYTWFGRTRDGHPMGETTAILYRTDRFDLIGHRTFWLSETPDSMSRGWDAALNRTCTYGIFRDKDSQREFAVFNTHFDHVGEESRVQSAMLIREIIDRSKEIPSAMVLLGDFNAHPEEAPIVILKKSWKHCADSEGTPMGTFNGFDRDRKDYPCIDYIFYPPEFVDVTESYVIQEDFDSVFASDHFPVWAEVSWK